jgi:microcin C transport system permease protein
MLAYLIRRLLLMIPTIFGITIIVFIIINLAPGSPVEQRLQEMRFGGGIDSTSVHGDVGVSEEVLEALKAQYGFDKPILTRYGIWLKNLATLDFGNSFTYEEPVLEVIKSKLPVSMQFGITSFFLSYLICIPLGLMMAVRYNSTFDAASSFLLFIFYSIPPFMLGILLIVFLGGGSFLDVFPIGGLHSEAYEELSFFGKVWDRAYHAALPLTCYVIGSFTTLTLLTKNSVLDEIQKDYVRTARAKGVHDKLIYMKHALRNALIPVITGFGSIMTVFFAGALLLEQIFNLDGIGLLGYSSILSRDYNVLMGLVFIQSVLFLLGNLLSDILYVLVDPRIDFS